MLLELAVKNFAIIEEMAVDFREGFAAITGETGAGKSILIGAISQVLGGRSSADLIRTCASQAEIEARFGLAKDSLAASLLQDAGIEADGEVILRRIISSSGRTKCSINGRMAPVSLLRDIGTQLINIYGQHEHQSLLAVERHLDLLDESGGHASLLCETEQCFLEVSTLEKRRADLEKRAQERSKREEYLRFQIGEISGAEVEIGEEERLRVRKKVLANARKLQETASQGQDALYESEGSVYERLSDLGRKVADAAEIDPDFKEAASSLEQASLHVEEAMRSLTHAASSLEFEPGELQKIEDRLALLHDLKRKYGADEEEILASLKEAKEELDSLESLERELAQAQSRFDEKKKTLLELAGRLTKARQKAAKKLSTALQKELSTLQMKGARFEVLVEPLARGQEELDLDQRTVGPKGADRAEFLLSANPGEEPRPLAKIASGGELSRIMLAIKTVLERAGRVPTLVFDEVDAGIGGQVAEVVGKKLAGVASDHQVLVVTHLPQIARHAGDHYHVGKTTTGGRTFTSLKLLCKDERIEEIARMISGDTLSKSALAHAREMLGKGA